MDIQKPTATDPMHVSNVGAHTTQQPAPNRKTLQLHVHCAERTTLQTTEDANTTKN